MSDWEIISFVWNTESNSLIITVRNMNSDEVRCATLDAMDIVNLVDLGRKLSDGDETPEPIRVNWGNLDDEPSAPIVPQCKFKEEVIGETHESLDAQQSCMIHPKYPDNVIQDTHHLIKRWLLKTPRTEEENQKLVLLAQKFCADRGLSDNFTCLDCDTRYICMLAYDPYSVDGECLLK